MDRNDVFAAVGLLLVAGGLWWIYPPISLIVVGLALMTLGVVGSKNENGDVNENDE